MIVIIPAGAAVPVVVGAAAAAPRRIMISSAVAQWIDKAPEITRSVAHLLILPLRRNVAKRLMKTQNHQVPRPLTKVELKTLIWCVIERYAKKKAFDSFPACIFTTLHLILMEQCHHLFFVYALL